MTDITERRIETNGISLNIAEQTPATGKPDKLVLMLHGFPESWYSWRHQFKPLAEAGYHAVAPDMRGYGKSDKPAEITAYNQVEIINDIIGLIPALGYDTAVVLGHDWGAPTAWGAALHHPNLVAAVGALSVPFAPRADRPPLDRLKEIFKDTFFYQLYFQEPGVAEAEFEQDIAQTLRKFYYMASGEFDTDNRPPKPADADMLSDLPDPDMLGNQKTGEWCTRSDLSFYVTEFTRSGFRGPLNYYRNLNLTWTLTAGAPDTIKQPAMFVAGDRDGVIIMAAEALQQMPERVPDLRINQRLPGIGHWTQQEAPAAVNDAILTFLKSL